MAHFPHLALVDNPFFPGFIQHVINSLGNAAGLFNDVGNIQIRRLNQHAFSFDVFLNHLPDNIVW